MNQQEIEERSIVDRYVRGELSEEELYEFEEYYFEHPEVLKDIALTEVMREALRAAPRPRPAEAVESWPQRLLGYISTPRWSLGATTAAVVLAGLLTVETLRGPRVGDSHPSSASVMPIVAEFSLVRMRGTQGAPPILQIKAPGAVSIAIDAAGMEPASLKTTLHGPEKDIELPRLIPDPSLGVATVVMPTQLLAPGSYVLELHDAHGSNIAYKFEVVP